MLGVGVQTWGTEVEALYRYWQAIDDLGFTRIAYGDGLGHWTFDGWTALGALAVLTRHARLGPAVTYAFDAAAHHPSWLAKRAATLDRLSGGRAELRLGIGAADVETARGWSDHGIGYPAAAQRIAMVEEAVTVVRALWTGKRVDHAGPHWHLSAATLAPTPVQCAGPPVWIAAMGPLALAATARCANGWEASYLSPAAFAARWTAVRDQLEACHRPAADFRRSVELDVVMAPAGDIAGARAAFCRARGIGPDHPLLETALIGQGATIAARIAEYAVAGVTDLMLGFADFPALGMLQQFAREVLPFVSSPPRGASPGRLPGVTWAR